MATKRLTTNDKLDLILKNQQMILNAVQILYKSLFANDDKVDRLSDLQQENQILLKKLIDSYEKVNNQFKTLQS